MIAKILREKRREDTLTLFVIFTLTIAVIIVVESLNTVLEDKQENTLDFMDEAWGAVHGFARCIQPTDYFRPFAYFWVCAIPFWMYEAYRDIRDIDEARCIEEAITKTVFQNPRLTNPDEKTFQTRLTEAGFSDEEVKNHPKIGFFYDPVCHEIVEDPVITNTGDMVDETTAAILVANRSRLFNEQVISYHGSPQLKHLLEVLVTEVVEEKSSRTLI